MKYLYYLNYVLRHKYYVFIECLRYGLIWRGIIHDWSKFLPSEFLPYANYFYGEDYYGRQEAFNKAWNHHQKINAHHWQLHVLIRDKPDEQGRQYFALPIPINDRKEMIADWRGAGMAQGKGRENAKDWYLENRHNILLAPSTRFWVESELGIDSEDFKGRSHICSALTPLLFVFYFS